MPRGDYRAVRVRFPAPWLMPRQTLWAACKVDGELLLDDHQQPVVRTSCEDAYRAGVAQAGGEDYVGRPMPYALKVVRRRDEWWRRYAVRARRDADLHNGRCRWCRRDARSGARP